MKPASIYTFGDNEARVLAHLIVIGLGRITKFVRLPDPADQQELERAREQSAQCENSMVTLLLLERSMLAVQGGKGHLPPNNVMTTLPAMVELARRLSDQAIALENPDAPTPT